jgi:hypothetical protein
MTILLPCLKKGISLLYTIIPAVIQTKKEFSMLAKWKKQKQISLTHQAALLIYGFCLVHR